MPPERPCSVCSVRGAGLMVAKAGSMQSPISRDGRMVEPVRMHAVLTPCVRPLAEDTAVRRRDIGTPRPQRGGEDLHDGVLSSAVGTD